MFFLPHGVSNIVVVVIVLVGGGRMVIKTEIFITVNSITNVDNFPKICQSICRFFFRNYSLLSMSKVVIEIQFQSSIKELLLILFYHNI